MDCAVRIFKSLRHEKKLKWRNSPWKHFSSNTINYPRINFHSYWISRYQCKSYSIWICKWKIDDLSIFTCMPIYGHMLNISYIEIGISNSWTKSGMSCIQCFSINFVKITIQKCLECQSCPISILINNDVIKWKYLHNIIGFSNFELFIHFLNYVQSQVGISWIQI